MYNREDAKNAVKKINNIARLHIYITFGKWKIAYASVAIYFRCKRFFGYTGFVNHFNMPRSLLFVFVALSSAIYFLYYIVRLSQSSQSIDFTDVQSNNSDVLFHTKLYKYYSERNEKIYSICMFISVSVIYWHQIVHKNIFSVMAFLHSNKYPYVFSKKLLTSGNVFKILLCSS